MVNYVNVAALTEYKKHSFVSVIHNKNLYGVQFHPEKSREAGIKLLSNFINLKVN
jgi:imidazoleglycerol phosphate synthase glutamine amidotransferase subunit HisH